MRRRAFTITELLIGVAIMSILAGVMTLNSSTIGRQTAKREAERAAAYIRDRMRRADMTHSVVWFTVDTSTNKIELKTGDKYSTAKEEQPAFSAIGKCEYLSELKLVYPQDKDIDLGSFHDSTYKHAVQGAFVTIGTGKADEAYFTIKGEDGKTCDVIIGR